MPFYFPSLIKFPEYNYLCYSNEVKRTSLSSTDPEITKHSVVKQCYKYSHAQGRCFYGAKKLIWTSFPYNLKQESASCLK